MADEDAELQMALMLSLQLQAPPLSPQRRLRSPTLEAGAQPSISLNSFCPRGSAGSSWKLVGPTFESPADGQ